MVEGKVLAAARDAWQASDEGRMLASDINGPVGGKYLRNRLEVAFIAGYEAAQPPAVGVDEAMVERACAEWWGSDWGTWTGYQADMKRAKARRILTAALRTGGGE